MEKTAEQLWQAMQINEQTSLKQTSQNPQHWLAEPIAAESIGYERIVVRPDGAIMIGHRVIADLGRCQGSDSLASKHLLCHEGTSDLFGMHNTGNLRKKTVACIRGTHPAEAFLAIQGQ